MFSKLATIFRIPELRRKIFITFALLIVYRIGNWIPIPGVNYSEVVRIADSLGGGAYGGVFALMNMVSGGGILQACLFSLGIMPYISASIIFQILTKVWPKLEEIAKEGDSGRKKIQQWTRYLTVVLCMFQSTFIIKVYLFRPWGAEGSFIVPLDQQTWYFMLIAALSFTAGAMFLLWLGEQITEFGIGEGVSLIIMAGIISRMPSAIYSLAEQVGTGKMPGYVPIVLLVLYVGIIGCVILITQGQRRIPVQYAKHTRGRRVYGMSQRTYIPFRVNMAGVMPVIFASSLLIFPQIILGPIGDWWPTLGFIPNAFTKWGGWFSVTLNVVLVIFFSYFWNALMFNPTEQADNMKQMGAFIPGFTPGKKTASFLEDVLNRVTLAGGAFLAAIAVFPNIMSGILKVDSMLTVFLGGTGILIVAGVALDMVTKIESHLVTRSYDGFLGKSGRIRGRRG